MAMYYVNNLIKENADRFSSRGNYFHSIMKTTALSIQVM